jgi:hypothetical protein
MRAKMKRTKLCAMAFALTLSTIVAPSPAQPLWESIGQPPALLQPNCVAPTSQGEADFCEQKRAADAADKLNRISTQQAQIAERQAFWSRVEAWSLIASIFFTAVAAVSPDGSTTPQFLISPVGECIAT